MTISCGCSTNATVRRVVVARRDRHTARSRSALTPQPRLSPGGVRDQLKPVSITTWLHNQADHYRETCHDQH